MRLNVRKITLGGMYIGVGLVLPFLTGQIKTIGNMLLPMHIPVLLCGLTCGWKYGLAVGVVLPLLRSVAFGMPVFYPNAIGMAFEMGTYGAVIGVLYERTRQKHVVALYESLIIAMVAGRLVWGMVRVILLGLEGDMFTWQMFLSGAVLNAIPGIILQLILIPAIMVALKQRNESSESIL